MGRNGSPCTGDSGGPLVLYTRNGPRLLGFTRGPVAVAGLDCGTNRAVVAVRVGRTGVAGQDTIFNWVRNVTTG